MWTSLWENVVFVQFHTLGSRVIGDCAHDKVSVEGVKLLPAVAVDGSSQTPHHREEEQSLQPQRHLLTCHRFCSFLSCLKNLICTHEHTPQIKYDMNKQIEKCLKCIMYTCTQEAGIQAHQAIGQVNG